MTIDAANPDFKANPATRPVRPRFVAVVNPAGAVPDVAIITPYFNTGTIFDDTVRSVLGQTFQNWEWIIVDDGSSNPECLIRLASLSGEDPRISVVHQENSGPGAARNTAFAHSSARYVCLLDSDDLVEPTYLEKCVWFLDCNGEFAFCNAFSIVFGDREHLWTPGFDRGREFLKANSGPPISVIRRTAYADVGGFDAAIRQGHEDWDFWLAMASRGHWGHTLPEYLQWYRTSGKGRFAQISTNKDLHAGFERRIGEKYAALARNFPNPQRRPHVAYEAPPITWEARNPLERNASGRRLLLILPWMVVGGADRVNLDLIDGMVSRGHQVTICTTLPSGNPWEHEFSKLTVDIFALHSFLRPGDMPRFLLYLIESRNIDTVLVSASTLGYQFLPMLRAWTRDVAFLDLCHVEEPHWQNGGHPRFGVGYQDALDFNIVTTANLEKWMAARGADPARIRIMYTGVRPAAATPDAVARQRVRAQLGIATDVPLIVWGGRICEQKRPNVLAEIFREVRDAGTNFEAVLIGDGELRPSLEALLSRYQLQKRVRMLGALAHDRWLEVLQAADILVMPSRYEGISVSVLEAMATGLVPVVAHVGGMAEIIGPSEGFLIEHGPNEIAEYRAVLCDLLLAPEKRAKMGKACRTLLESKYSWAGTIDFFEKVLDDAQAAMHGRSLEVTRSFGRELATQAIEQLRVADALTGQWGRAQHGATEVTYRVGAVVDAQLVRAALMVGRVRLVRRVLASRKFQGAAHFVYRLLRNRTFS